MGTISDYYNYEFGGAQDAYYSVELRDVDYERVHAYLRKDAPDAQALFNLLKDGKEHPLMVELSYAPGSKAASVVRMTRFLADSWKERPEEFTKPSVAAAKRPGALLTGAHGGA